MPVEQRRPYFDRLVADGTAARGLKAAGLTWEALAGLLNGPLDAAAWSAMGVVARSRMFPFRWVAAYEQAPSPRWGHALGAALQASLANLPSLPGRALILVDTSASMSSGGFSKHSTMSPVKAAAVFGVALAAKGEQVDLFGFADGVFRHDVPAGASVIRVVKRFTARVGEVGHGTQIAASLRATYGGHNRVLIVSGMQTMDRGTGRAVPDSVPMYGFNLAAATGRPRTHRPGTATSSAA